MKKFLFSATFALLAATALSGTVSAADRGLSVEQAAIAEVQPAGEQQGIGITATLNSESSEYYIGDSIELTVRVDEPAYLTVLNISEDGSVTVLYPNRFNTMAYVPADTDLLLPGEGAQIVAVGDPGVELIKVFATEKPLDVTNLDSFRAGVTFDSAGAGTASRLADTISSRALSVTETSEEASGEAEVPNNGSRTETVTAWGEATLSLVTLAADDAPIATKVLSELELTADKPSYQLGEAITLTATANAACDLSVVAIGPMGSTTVLAPSAAVETTTLEAGQSMEMGPFRADGPAGMNIVRAICASSGGSLDTPQAEEDGNMGTMTRDVSLMEPVATPVAAIAEATLVFAIVEE